MALSFNDNSRDECVPATYTFPNVYCGAGGASCGAEIVVLQSRWALDNNTAARETYRLDLPQVRLFHPQIKDVAHTRREYLEADIMHFSPPCQACPSAKTNPNLKNDAVNRAANKEVGSC